METINSIANSASKAIFGEGNTATDSKEPVAGSQGAGTTTEPFDKGNLEDSKKSDSEIPASEQDSKHQPSTTTNPDLSAKDTSGSTDTKTKSGKDAMPHTDEEREALVMKGEFPHDPNDHSGEPLHMHDGSEKKEESKDESGDPRTEGKKDRSASVSQEGGNPHGKTLGTGEQYVKSSGVAADGGDFDATNPGAGAEATRLLEEKGIHKEKPSGAAPTAASSTSDVSSKAGKPSKLAKLKEKLHIGRSKDKADKVDNTHKAAKTDKVDSPAATPATSAPAGASPSAPTSSPAPAPGTTTASATPTTTT